MTLTGDQKRYRIRRAQSGIDSLEVTFPFKVIERKAWELDTTVDVILETHSVVMDYDHDVVTYRLELTPTK